MKHPTIEQMEKYLNAGAGLFMKSHIERHLAKCTECSEKLEELKEAEQLAEELKQSIKVFAPDKESKNSDDDPTFFTISKIFGPAKHGTSV